MSGKKTVFYVVLSHLEMVLLRFFLLPAQCCTKAHLQVSGVIQGVQGHNPPRMCMWEDRGEGHIKGGRRLPRSWSRRHLTPLLPSAACCQVRRAGGPAPRRRGAHQRPLEDPGGGCCETHHLITAMVYLVSCVWWSVHLPHPPPDSCSPTPSHLCIHALRVGDDLHRLLVGAHSTVRAHAPAQYTQQQSA